MHACTYVCMYVFIYYFVAKNQITRSFIECFEKGIPNFLSVPPCKLILYMRYYVTITLYLGDIFKTVISMYAQGNYKLSPLPSLEEVLICDHNTTVEEVISNYLCQTITA